MSCAFLCGYVDQIPKNTEHTAIPNIDLLGQRALSLLADEGLVDVGDDSSAGNGGLDQRVQLLVS